MRGYADWSLWEELSACEQNSRVALPEFAQVTNFAIQVALAELWARYGVTPAAVIGHSGGAMAAAYTAGVYSLEDALRLTFHRSRLQGRPSNEGRMLAVGAPVEELAELLEGAGDSVSVAAINGPAMVSLAGDADALEKLCAQLLERHIFARMLPVTIAYHNQVMDNIREEFLASVADLRGRTASLPLVSDTTGSWADGSECDVHYWWRAIRQPVLFHDGIKHLIESGHQHFLEISPHPVLASSIAACLKEQGVSGLCVASLRRSEDERQTMWRALGALYTIGVSPNWAVVQRPGHLVPLPVYPWQRERFWFEPSAQSPTGTDHLVSRTGDHPLLGSRTRSARPAWEHAVGTRETEYLHDHVVQGLPLLPGAASVELALAAGSSTTGPGPLRLRDLEFVKPLELHPDGSAIQLFLDAESGRLEIFSSGQTDAWTCFARGFITTSKHPSEDPLDVEALRRPFGCLPTRKRFTPRW